MSRRIVLWLGGLNILLLAVLGGREILARQARHAERVKQNSGYIHTLSSEYGISPQAATWLALRTADFEAGDSVKSSDIPHLEALVDDTLSPNPESRRQAVWLSLGRGVRKASPEVQRELIPLLEKGLSYDRSGKFPVDVVGVLQVTKRMSISEGQAIYERYRSDERNDVRRTMRRLDEPRT